MRSFVLTALLGSIVASTGLVAQSLTEHAAAAAGATIGTAAGKPLGTSLGKVFGGVDQSATNVTTTKTTKPVVIKSKPAPAPPAVATVQAPTAPLPSVGGGEASVGSGSGRSSHHSARRRERVVKANVVVPAPIMPVVAAQALVKEPTTEDVASIKVGASASELRALLGAPESRVSIPGDDGHLLEICQYWAKGEPLGTIRLDNGRVISVQVQN
jgi:hypothetical protein